jgi:hypothetical protein
MTIKKLCSLECGDNNVSAYYVSYVENMRCRYTQC